MQLFSWRKQDAVEELPAVSMYTLSVCPSCDKAKKFFTEHHIPFQFVNYDQADQATQDRILRELEAEELQAFPFVRIGDQVVQGYDPKRYARLLGIAAPGRARTARSDRSAI